MTEHSLVKASQGYDQSLLDQPIDPPNEVISLEESRVFLISFNLTDDQVRKLKDNLVGIVESLLTSYLNRFR